MYMIQQVCLRGHFRKLQVCFVFVKSRGAKARIDHWPRTSVSFPAEPCRWTRPGRRDRDPPRDPAFVPCGRVAAVATVDLRDESSAGGESKGQAGAGLHPREEQRVRRTWLGGHTSLCWNVKPTPPNCRLRNNQQQQQQKNPTKCGVRFFLTRFPSVFFVLSFLCFILYDCFVFCVFYYSHFIVGLIKLNETWEDSISGCPFVILVRTKKNSATSHFSNCGWGRTTLLPTCKSPPCFVSFLN